MKEISVAVLGTGFIGKVHTYAYQSLPFFYDGLPFRIKLKGVYSRTLQSAEKAKENYGFEFATDCIDDIFSRNGIDAVSICLPNYQHKECVLKAIEKGIAVYCEKPLTANAEDAEEILRELENKSVVNRIVFQNRYFACVLRAKKLIEDGKLGRILSFRACYQHPGNVDKAVFNWKFEKEFCCGGVLYDMGSHALDMLYYMLGEYKSISAKMQIAHPKRVDQKGTVRQSEVEDAAYIIAEMKDGSSGTIQVSKIAAGTNDDFTIEIYGEKGALKFDLMDPNWVEFYDNTIPQEPLGGYRGFTKIESVQRYPKPGGDFPSPKLAGGWLRAHIHSMYDFLNCVYEGKPGSPDLSDGAYIQYVMQKAYESDKSGKRIEL